MILHTSCRAPLQSPGCEQFSVIIHGGIFHLSKSHCILLEVLLRTKNVLCVFGYPVAGGSGSAL